MLIWIEKIGGISIIHTTGKVRVGSLFLDLKINLILVYFFYELEILYFDSIYYKFVDFFS